MLRRLQQRLLALVAALAPRLPAPGNAAMTGALLAITVGLWWERPSLALIVPGLLVFLSLAYDRLRGEDPPEPAEEEA